MVIQNLFIENYIKSLRQSSSGVSALTCKITNNIATSALEKVTILNKQLQSVFTKEDGILKLLKELKIQKAQGPDNITPKILKACADSIAPLLQQIYQKYWGIT